MCQARVTMLSIAIRCDASADTPESGMDIAALVCQRAPLSGIDEGTLFFGTRNDACLLFGILDDIEKRDLHHNLWVNWQGIDEQLAAFG